MHAGKSPGAPAGRHNGNYRHGKQTQERIKERRELRALCREGREAAAECRKAFAEFRQMARDLGVSTSDLFKLVNGTDGALEKLVIERVKAELPVIHRFGG